MMQLWRQYAAKIDAMSLRERAMIFVAAIVVAVFIVDALFIAPALTSRKALVTRMAQQQVELQVLQTKTREFEKLRADPDAAARARHDSIRRQMTEIDENLKSLQQGLVPAEKMQALLQEMLARNPNLQLVAMRTLPVAPLVEKREQPEKTDATGAPAAPDKPSAAEGNVFKHGVRITVQGSYANLYEYLARLEKVSARMFWSRASLSAVDYPRLTLTVTIYTLSLDKAWLVV